MKLINKYVSVILLSSAVIFSGCATKKEAAPITKQPKLTIIREVPQSIKLNSEYTYTLKVTNNSNYKIDNAIVRENLPNNFELTKVNPPTEEKGRTLAWDLGTMIPNQIEIINITSKPTAAGKINYSGSSATSFYMKPMQVFTEVIAAGLALTASGPEESLVGDEIPVRLAVKNTGTSVVQDIALPHIFPANMTTINGEKQINIKVGDIEVGQSINIPLNLVASQRGKYVNNFTVTTKDGIKVSTDYSVLIKQPKLDFSANAPAVRYVGNIIPYKLEVHNSGDGESRGMEATLILPPDMKFVSANEGGEFNADTVTWTFKDFFPNETKTFVAKLISQDIRVVRATAQVKDKNSNVQKIPLTTDVQGIPAILVNIADVNDPIAVGEIEEYIVTVTNQGSLAATNVIINCELESSMQFARSTGPTVSSAKDSSKITFAPLPSLAPKQQATWHVYVKALKPGDVRFTVNIICDQLERPVTGNESTTFYTENKS